MKICTLIFIFEDFFDEQLKEYEALFQEFVEVETVTEVDLTLEKPETKELVIKKVGFVTE